MPTATELIKTFLTFIQLTDLNQNEKNTLTFRITCLFQLFWADS
jgi:hypothetical protein